jgi:hypothetical protein
MQSHKEHIELGPRLLHILGYPAVGAGGCGKGLPCGGGVSSNDALLFILCALPTTPWTCMHTWRMSGHAHRIDSDVQGCVLESRLF